MLIATKKQRIWVLWRRCNLWSKTQSLNQQTFSQIILSTVWKFKNPKFSFSDGAHLFLLCSDSLPTHTYTRTHTDKVNHVSIKGHLFLPGLPGDEEEAVVGSIDPVGASLANHYSSPGVSAAATAAVVLQRKQVLIFSLQYAEIKICRKGWKRRSLTIRGTPVEPGFSARENKMWE